MAQNSKIEWTEATWNPLRARHKATGKLGWHCTHVSEGCRNCYAERMNAWRGTGLPFKPGHAGDIDLYLDEKILLQPLSWRKPRMIFPCSMTDLFGEWVSDEMIDKIFAVMALTPRHTYQIATKRPARMRAYMTHDDGYGRWGFIEHQARKIAAIPRGITLAHYGGSNLPNVWLGVSCEDQATADQRIPDLLATPAAIRWISAEPLLGPIQFDDLCDGHKFIDALRGNWWHDNPHGSNRISRGHNKLDWIVVGGESGPGARPMHPDWVRDLRDQCAAAGVPFFMKQMDKKQPIPTDLLIREMPHAR